MNNWKPSDIFTTESTLRLTDAEKYAIRKKLPSENGKFYVDAVFEGGGVKGTAFLGALRCFDDVGVTFRKVAGTSAGAITAAMLAAGFSQQKLEDILGQLNYVDDLLKQKTSRFILNGSPADDLDNPLLMLVNLFFVCQKGQYSTEPFLTWLQSHLDHDEHGNPRVFSFDHLQSSTEHWYDQRELRVVISDITQKAMRVLPTELGTYDKISKPLSVAEAVRLSMSIPLFFEPGQLGDSTIVDGGVLSNFPLWIYDAPPYQRPKCPTFGFQLVEPEPPAVAPTRTAIGVFRDMLNTMLVAGDRHYVARNEQGRVIRINTGGIKATQFDLTTAQKDSLYKAGYEAAKTFLLDQWDWEKHLQARGFEK